MKEKTEVKPTKTFYCWQCHTGCESDEYDRFTDGADKDYCPNCGYPIYT